MAPLPIILLGGLFPLSLANPSQFIQESPILRIVPGMAGLAETAPDLPTLLCLPCHDFVPFLLLLEKPAQGLH